MQPRSPGPEGSSGAARFPHWQAPPARPGARRAPEDAHPIIVASSRALSNCRAAVLVDLIGMPSVINHSPDPTVTPSG
eukprot:881341-Rhodomonas_salina.1